MNFYDPDAATYFLLKYQQENDYVDKIRHIEINEKSLSFNVLLFRDSKLSTNIKELQDIINEANYPKDYEPETFLEYLEEQIDIDGQYVESPLNSIESVYHGAYYDDTFKIDLRCKCNLTIFQRDKKSKEEIQKEEQEHLRILIAHGKVESFAAKRLGEAFHKHYLGYILKKIEI